MTFSLYFSISPAHLLPRSLYNYHFLHRECSSAIGHHIFYLAHSHISNFESAPNYINYALSSLWCRSFSYYHIHYIESVLLCDSQIVNHVISLTHTFRVTFYAPLMLAILLSRLLSHSQYRAYPSMRFSRHLACNLSLAVTFSVHWVAFCLPYASFW